jgi:LysR family transcriptional regulator, carnitine catabolism transcriptional activator
MTVDLRQLRYVMAIVDHGTFTEAARAMHVAQPSLSQSVRALEAELGVELFQRTGRHARLTSAGEALVGPARRALRDVETAQAAVAAVVGVRAGHLDIVCLPTLAVYPAAELIGRFRRATPDVSVALHEAEVNGSLPELVRDGRSELGFAELPVSTKDLETHELARQDYVAVLSPDADVESLPDRRLSLVALSRLPLITTPPGTSTRRQVDEAFAMVDREPNIAVVTDHRDAIGPLVLAGAGFSLLPRTVAEDAVRLGAVTREVTPRISRRIGLIHRTGPLSPAAQAFITMVLPDTAPAPRRPRPRRRRA